MPAPEMFGPAMLGVTQGIGLFQNFLPKFTDIRKADPTHDRDFVKDVRMGEIGGVTLTIGIGVIASGLTGSPVPAFIAMLISTFLVLLYESALRAVPEVTDNG